jgi:hypothetical protein
MNYIKYLNRYFTISLSYGFIRSCYYVNGPLYKKNECNSDRINHVIIGTILCPLHFCKFVIIDYSNYNKLLKDEWEYFY